MMTMRGGLREVPKVMRSMHSSSEHCRMQLVSQRPTHTHTHAHAQMCAHVGENGSGRRNRRAHDVCQTSRCLEGGLLMNGSLHIRLKSPLR